MEDQINNRYRAVSKQVAELRRWVKEEFGFNDEQTELLFEDRTNLCLLPKNKLKDRIQGLIEIFESEENFFKMIEAQQMGYSHAPKTSLLSLQVETVKGRLELLKKMFDVDTEEVISFWEGNPRWMLYYSANKIQECVEKFASSVNLSLKKVKPLFFMWPQWSYKDHYSFLKSVEDVAKYFDVPQEKVVNFLLERPKLGWRRSNYYKEAGVTSIVLDKPWLMDCISNYKDYNYGGYKHFSTLVEVTEFIETVFGKVKRVITRKFENEGVLKCLLIAPSEKYNYYKLVTLGSGYVTKDGKERIDNYKFLRAIFGDKMPEQYEKEDHFELVYHLGEVTEWSLELASTLLLVMATEDSPYKSFKMLKTKELLWRVPPYTYKDEKSYEKSQLKFSHEQYDVKFEQMIVLSEAEMKTILEQGIHKEIFKEQAIIEKIFGGQEGFEKALLDFSRTSSIKKK